jgi:hypothetical protein
VQSSVTSGGVEEYGIDIQSANFPLLTSPDTFFILTQSDTYSSPRIKIKFPAFANSSWQSLYKSDFNYEISYAPLLSHAPGVVRTYYIEKDTVVGWGKVRVRDAAGNPSGHMDVLQVQTTIMTVDSFFLNGSSTDPILPTLLATLNLQQAEKDTIYQLNFYRAGEVTPLVQVKFKDAAFIQIAGATYHRQRLADPAAAGIAGEQEIKIYPNPLCGNKLLIQLPSFPGEWTYVLTGMDGRSVAAGSISVHGATGKIVLPSISRGQYNLALVNNDKVISIQTVEIKP